MKKDKALVIAGKGKIRSLLKLYLIGNKYEVVVVENEKAGLRAIERHRPKVIILDIILPDISAFETCKEIRNHSGIPIIYLITLQESETVIFGLEFGGNDFLTKHFDPNVLVAGINVLLKRTKDKGLMEQEKIERRFEQLTHQERKILRCIEKGYTNKEIGAQLMLTEGTIKMYNYTIFQKLQVKNRTQAIVRAKEARFI